MEQGYLRMIHAWDAESARRIVQFVRAHERGDIATGKPGDTRPRKLQLTPMVCLSQPNIEAIGNGGAWPSTITAKVIREVDGYSIPSMTGLCHEPIGGDGGGGGICRVRTPCAEGRCLDLHWGTCTIRPEDGTCGSPYVSPGVYVGRLKWAGGYDDDGVPVWRWVTDDGQYIANGSPTIENPTGCGSLVVQYEGDNAGQQWSLGYFPGRGGDLCRPRVELGDTRGSGGASSLWATWVDCDAPQSDSPYVDTGELDDASEPDTAVDANDGDGTGGVRAPERIEVRIGQFGCGVPLRGEAFAAVNYGGAWHHVGIRNQNLVGALTADDSPRTILVENCENRVPFVYPIDDPNVAEGSRHVIAWNTVKRRYVALSWECL